MPFIEWNDSFLVGVSQFDEHHRHLVGLINTLYDDFTAGAPVEATGNVLDELIEYATYHFLTEEFWMEKQSYPGLDAHTREHDRFARRVVEMQKDYHAGKINISLELLAFLRNWLSDHILKTDLEYGRYASANGAPLSPA